MANKILIDLRAPARRVSDEELRAWAQDQRAFISSVITELSAERRAVVEAVQEAGAEAVWFENFGGRDADPEAAYLAEVAMSTIYVGILGTQYGRIHRDTRRSATHEEYRRAEQCGLRICVWIKENGDYVASQKAFIDEVRVFHVTGNFSAPEDLNASVRGRLQRLAAEDLSPWCKLDHVVFRATSVRDSGKKIEIHATVHDPAVVAALEEMRPNMFRDLIASTTRKLTYSSRSRPVDVKDVETHVSAARSTQVRMVVVPGIAAPDKPYWISWGTDYSLNQVIAINLGKALYGTRVPNGLVVIGGGLGDPLTVARSAAVTEDILRPLIHLGLTEALVGNGQVARVTKVSLSQDFGGERQLDVEWQPLDSALAPGVVSGKLRL